MTIDTFFNLEGPVGSIEAVLTQPTTTVSTVVIICHPHPLYGGSLQNKVVHTLMRTFRELNIASVRFNFRGVGKSAGVYDHGVGEVDDLLTVINWTSGEFPNAHIWLSGFSFGAVIAVNVLSKTPQKIEQLILIAPPVDKFDTSSITLLDNPVCVFIGDQDEIVDPNVIEKWVHQYPRVELIRIFEAGHFFHGKLALLKDKIIAYLSKTYPDRWSAS